MKLFDAIKREPLTTASNRYSAFVTVNQDCSPRAQEIRNTLETWFEKFPTEGQEDLRGRFRSPRPDVHESAFFELFLHEVMTNLGFALEVHPNLADSTHRPDFLVRDGNISFYLEAGVAGRSSGPFTRRNEELEVIEALETLTSPNFNLLIELTGELSKSVRTRRLLSKVRSLLQEHDPDKVKAIIDAQGRDAAPYVQDGDDNWRIEVWLIPISSPARRPGEIRPVKVNFRRSHRTNAITPVRNKIQEKSRSYGHPQLPLVIAVQARDQFYNGRDCDMEVLFGNDVILYVDDVAEIGHEPNGVWSTGHGTRVAAFLSFQKADIWNFHYASGCLYINPTQPGIVLPAAIFHLTHWKIIQGKKTWVEGDDIRKWLSNGCRER